MKKDVKRDNKKSNINTDITKKDYNKDTRIDSNDNLKRDTDRSNLANTLDHYDEAMTINAVGRLLDKSNKLNTADASLEHTIRNSFAAELKKERKEKNGDYRDILYNHKSDYSETSKVNFPNISKRADKHSDDYGNSSNKKSSRSQNRNSVSSSRTKMTVSDEDDYRRIALTEIDDYEQLEDETTPVSVLRVVVFCVFLTFLGTLVFLVFRINTLTRHLDQLQAGVTIEQPIDVEILMGQRDELQEQVVTLESIVTDLLDQVYGLDFSEDGNQVADTTSPSNETTESQPQAGGPTIHIVQAGQSLSSLSTLYFGVSNEYQRIIDANNLTSTNLSLGQELIIPN